MADHYYTAQPESKHKPALVTYRYRGEELRFETDSGVFSRTEIDKGTDVLLCALPQELSGAVLDMGCGYGVIGVTVGRHWKGTRITMADVNERACGLSMTNAQKNGVAAAVIPSDGYEKVLGNTYDLILQNPPIRAGKAVIYKMFADAARCLAPGGQLWLVIRKQQGAPSALTYLRTLYGRAEVVEKEAGYWIICCEEPLPQEEKHENV
ncbi:MAG: methyltransferase domain-containing protein [Clostridiales bacterium]|nr:methyltransferase domain-containing protein [Clostridiales bacterium]